MKQLYIIVILCFLSHILAGQGVGVGTTSPHASAALDVSSVAQGMLVPRMTTAQRTAISNPATGLLVFDMTTNSFWFKGGTIWVELIDSSKTIIHKNGSDVFMAINGNVGIGTNTPTTKLEVKTTAASPGITHNDGTIKISSLTTALVGKFGTTTNHPLHLMSNNGINQLTILPSGNIGIGIATPPYPLSFPNTIGNKISLSGTVGNHFGLGLGAGLLQVFADASTSNIGFGYGHSTSFTELMRMTGTGRFGIGTINPSAMLEVVRGTATDGNLFLRGTTHNTYFNQSTNEHTTINGGKNGSNILLNVAAGTGNVGIGIAAPTQKLDVNGSVNISGGLAVGVGVTVAAGVAVGAGLAVGGAVGIGTTTPNASAALDMTSTTKGFLPPRMTTAQREAIQNPAEGLTVYDQTTNSPWYRTENNWEEMKDTVDQEVFRNGPDRIYMGLTDSVGVGISTPQHKLQVKTGNAQYGISHTNGTVDLVTHVSNTNGGSIGTKSNHPFKLFANNGSNQLVLTPEGNVGIGVANPIASIEVARGAGIGGTATFKGTSHNSVFNFATNEDTYIRGGKANSNIIMNDIAGLGNVGVGTATPAHKLHVVGNAYIQGNANITQKLGIGTTTPNAALQLDNVPLFRRVVLWEFANNEHQFNGFGGDALVMRYQIGGTTSNHVFCAATSSSGSNELMRIQGNGNVGIGTSIPHAPLQFSNTYAARKIVLFENGDNDNNVAGIGFTPSVLRYQLPSIADNHIFYAGNSSSTSVELMRVTGFGHVGIGVNNPTATLEVARGTGINGTAAFLGTLHNSVFNFGTEEHTYIRGGKAGSHIIINDIAETGNVGIGTGAPLQKLHVQGDAFITQKLGIGMSTPNAPLQFPNTDQNRKIVLWDDYNTDHQFNGFGGNQSEMRYQVANPDVDHVFYAGTSSTTSDELMRVKGNGVVEIPGNASVAGNVAVAGTLDIGYSIEGSGALIQPLSSQTVTCFCPPGTKVLGGGWSGVGLDTTKSQPSDAEGSGWSVHTTNLSPLLPPTPISVYAICARLGD